MNNNSATNLAEKTPINVYLRSMNKDTIANIRRFIIDQPYSLDVEYTDKEKAKQIWNEENNADWAEILDENPLPESIDFSLKANYANVDSVQQIAKGILAKYGKQVTDVKYSLEVFKGLERMNQAYEKMKTMVMSGIVLLGLVVIFSIWKIYKNKAWQQQESQLL